MDVDGLLVYLREIAAGLLTLSVRSSWKWHVETTYVSRNGQSVRTALSGSPLLWQFSTLL